MNKVKKIFWSLVILLVVLLVIVVIVAGLSLGKIVKAGVETVGPKITQVPVTVDAVNLSLLTGAAPIEVLRTGDLAAAKDAFSKFPKDQLVAQAYARVLERYPDGTFLGEKLSQPDVLWRASTGEAKHIVSSHAKELGEASKHAEDEPKLETDTKMAMSLQKLEREMDVANQLEIGAAQPALVQVLYDEYYYQAKRFYSLDKEHDEAVAEIHGAVGKGSFQVHLRKIRAIEAQLKVIQREIERIIARIKTEAAGFKLEAPQFKEAPEN